MTTPTTNLTMSSIQTEFGGSNPISLSEYYQGGGNVPSGQSTSATDGTAIPTSGTIRMGEFRGITKTSANIQSFSVLAFNTAASTGLRSATFRLNSDGSSQRSNGASLATTTNWYSPTTSSIGTSYWAKATITTPASGGTLNGNYGSWIQLTSGSSWSISNSSTTSEATGAIQVIIAASSGGSTLGTIDVNFDAGYTP